MLLFLIGMSVGTCIGAVAMGILASSRQRPGPAARKRASPKTPPPEPSQERSSLSSI